VTNLILSTEDGYFSSRRHNKNVLRPFNNTNTLLVPHDLVLPVSRSLRLNNEGCPFELLPELKELACDGIDDSLNAGVAFAPFINARRNAGRPVTLIIVPP
jgi:hypothetical protein